MIYPRALPEELVFDIMLAEAKMLVKGSDPTKLAYELTNIQLEYEVIHSVSLAREAESTYINGKQFMYDLVSHHKTISVKKDADPIINESINISCRSMKGILLLFSEPHNAGARGSKKVFNSDITGVKVCVNGVPSKVYSQGIEALDMRDEVIRHFSKYDKTSSICSSISAL